MPGTIIKRAWRQPVSYAAIGVTVGVLAAALVPPGPAVFLLTFGLVLLFDGAWLMALGRPGRRPVSGHVDGMT